MTGSSNSAMIRELKSQVAGMQDKIVSLVEKIELLGTQYSIPFLIAATGKKRRLSLAINKPVPNSLLGFNDRGTAFQIYDIESFQNEIAPQSSQFYGLRWVASHLCLDIGKEDYVASDYVWCDIWPSGLTFEINTNGHLIVTK